MSDSHTYAHPLAAALLLAVTLAGSGCVSLPELKAPATTGERNAGYTYIPIDPLPVESRPGKNCRFDKGNGRSVVLDMSGPPLEAGQKLRPVLDDLPDNAVRMAIREYGAKGTASVGPFKLGAEGQRYQVILDYINVDSTSLRFFIQTDPSSPTEVRRISQYRFVFNDGVTSRDRIGAAAAASIEGNVVIPVYVGVGLRLTADLQILKGNVNLSNLGAIAAAVESGQATGTLVVQTIGVTGKQVAASLPLPSSLNQTTVQNAIMSLGSIKAVIHDEKSTTITPRITGLYLPLRDANEAMVNQIVSEIAREPVLWQRGCASE